MNFTNIEDHANATDPLKAGLAAVYRTMQESGYPDELIGLMERAAIHIEAAYHLLTVADTIQLSTPTEPDNIVEFGAKAQQ